MVGNVNHVLICLITIYNFSTVKCDWFNDDACMMSPHRNFRRAIFMNIGYHIYDFIIITFVTEVTNTSK